MVLITTRVSNLRVSSGHFIICEEEMKLSVQISVRSVNKGLCLTRYRILLIKRTKLYRGENVDHRKNIFLRVN